MDTGDLLLLLQEFAYLLGAFGFFLAYSIIRGRQALINLIVGLYFALLISLEFPYYEMFLQAASDSQSDAIGKCVIFAIFALISTILVTRLMPEAYREGKFESFGKKLLLTIGATVLVMIFTFHVLPLTEFVTPGTPIQAVFAPATYFFWWLLAPLVVLYLN
jgi:hypothetical protein